MPLEIRQRLGLKTGDRIEFVVEQDHITIRPAHHTENSFLQYAGALPAFSTSDDINAWVRELRDEDAENK